MTGGSKESSWASKAPNVFKEFEQKQDTHREKYGKLMTVIFILLFVAAIVILSAFFGLRKNVIVTRVPAADSTSAPPITYEQYLGVAMRDPICPCTRPSNLVRDFATHNYALNWFCDPAIKFLPPGGGISKAIDKSDGILSQLSRLCFTASRLVNSSSAGILRSHLVTPVLMTESLLKLDLESRFELTEETNRAIFGLPLEISTLWAGDNMPTVRLYNRTDVGTEYTTLDKQHFLGFPGKYYIAGQGNGNQEGLDLVLHQKNGNCDCNEDWFCNTTRSSPDGTSYSSYCDHLTTHMNIEISQFALNSTETAKYTTCCNTFSSSTCQGSRGENCFESAMHRNLQNVARTRSTMKYGLETLFLDVDQTSVVINHRNYFAKCAPKFCEYSEVATPEPLVVLTIVIGLLGGLASGLKIICKVIYDLLVTKSEKEDAVSDVALINPRDNTIQVVPSEPSSKKVGV